MATDRWSGGSRSKPGRPDWLRVGLSDVIVAQGTSGDWWMRRMWLAVSIPSLHARTPFRAVAAKSMSIAITMTGCGAAVDRTVTEEHVPASLSFPT
ncbi:MAG: hypothetical protein U0905_21535 [Pirellulales bacterium]